MRKLLLLLPLLSALTTVRAYSQEPYIKEILWSVSSVEALVFQNKEQIVKWLGKTSDYDTSVQTLELQIQDNNVLIIMRRICSGLSCMEISVFKEIEDGLWSFVTASHELVYLRYMLEVKADDNEQALLFISGPDVIGRIAYEFLKK